MKIRHVLQASALLLSLATIHCGVAEVDSPSSQPAPQVEVATQASKEGGAAQTPPKGAGTDAKRCICCVQGDNGTPPACWWITCGEVCQ